jgi:lipoprotein signal peptidase
VSPTETIINLVFNFTPTNSPGVVFESMGNDKKSLVLYLGMSFLIMLLIGLQYLVYALAFFLQALRQTSKMGRAEVKSWSDLGCSFSLDSRILF